MKRPACTRAWQAEALEDGRLSGAERASFERHAASCAECASELRALVRLRQSAGVPWRVSLPPAWHDGDHLANERVESRTQWLRICGTQLRPEGLTGETSRTDVDD